MLLREQDSMLRKTMLGALVAAVFGAGAAQAVTTTVDIVGPTNVTVGATENFTVNYSFTDVPTSYTYASGSATYSVDGNALGSATLDANGGSFGFSYTFAVSGDYVIDVLGTINFYDQVYQYLYTYTYSYTCYKRGRPRTCGGSYPVYGYQTQVVDSGQLSGSLGVNASAVPLPASAVLLLGALGGLGLMRRRAKAA